MDQNTTDVAKITEALYERNRELAVITKNLSLLKKLYHISLTTLNRDELTEKLSTLIKTELELTSVVISPAVEGASQPDSSAQSQIFPLFAHEKEIGAMAVSLNRDYDKLSEHERNSIESTVDV